jgi:DHA2 family multidrug resistance protein-like MFS transporter
MLTAPFAGRLADRFSMGFIGAAGLAVFAAGLLLIATSVAGASMLDLAWRISVTGAGFALFGPPNTRGILEGAPPGRAGAATGLNNAFRGLAQSSGAALVAVLFAHLAHGQANDYSTRFVLYLAACITAVGVALCLIRQGAGIIPQKAMS